MPSLKKSSDGLLIEEETNNQSEPLKVDLFCSEFIIKCFQEALAHITDRKLSEDELESIDLKANASSPMLFEGYITNHRKSWTRLGKILVEFM
jgi:hypothetical protein